MPALTKMTGKEFLALLPERERSRKRPDLDKQPEKIRYGVFGNFTLIVIIDNKGELWPGVTKRMPTDVPSDAGMKEAAARAWKLWHGRDPGYCRKHPVSKRGAKRMSARAYAEKINERKIEAVYLDFPRSPIA